MSQFLRRLAKLKGPAFTSGDSHKGGGGGSSREINPAVQPKGVDAFTRLHLIDDEETKDRYRYHLNPLTPAVFHLSAVASNDPEENSNSAEGIKHVVLYRNYRPGEQWEVSRCMRIFGDQTESDSQFWIEFPDGDCRCVVTVLLTPETINATCDMNVPSMAFIIPDETKESKESTDGRGIWRPAGESSGIRAKDDGAPPPYMENEDTLPSYSDIHTAPGYISRQSDSFATSPSASSSKKPLLFSSTKEPPPLSSPPEEWPLGPQASPFIGPKHETPERELRKFTWEQVSPLARFKLYSSSKFGYDQTSTLHAEFILETSGKQLAQGIKGQLIIRASCGKDWERWVLCTLGILVSATEGDGKF